MSSPLAAPPSISADELVARLEGVRRSGERRWTARCPAHGDKGPSLSVREGDDGRVLLNCFAGCTFPDIAKALGLEARQLFPPRDETLLPHRPRRQRPDPDREARELYDRLTKLRVTPDPSRIEAEALALGHIILGGTAGLSEVAEGFTSKSFRLFEFRLAYEAVQELARQGTPRRWFSPLAIAHVIDAAYGEPGNARRLDIIGWLRFAVRIARTHKDDAP